MKKILYVLLLVGISGLYASAGDENSSSAHIGFSQALKELNVIGQLYDPDEDPSIKIALPEEVAAMRTRLASKAKMDPAYKKKAELFFAIDENSLPLVEYFIKHNPELMNKEADFLGTPLYKAASTKTKDIFERLKSAGAQFDTKLTKQHSHTKKKWFVTALEDSDIEKAAFLIDAGAELNGNYNDSLELLVDSIRKDLQIMKLSIAKPEEWRNAEEHIDPSIQKWLDVLQKALNSGARIKTETKDNGFVKAVELRYGPIVRLFMQAGTSCTDDKEWVQEELEYCKAIEKELAHEKKAKDGHSSSSEKPIESEQKKNESVSKK